MSENCENLKLTLETNPSTGCKWVLIERVNCSCEFGEYISNNIENWGEFVGGSGTIDLTIIPDPNTAWSVVLRYGHPWNIDLEFYDFLNLQGGALE